MVKMLETLVSVVNCIRITFYYALYYSYKTGSVLVNSLYALSKCVVTFFENCFSFLAVLYESLVIFCQDIFQFVQNVLILFSTTVETIYTSVATNFLKIITLVSSVVGLITSIFTGIVSGITAVFASIGQIVVIFKKLLILFGSGIWFLITLLPLLIYYICTICVSLIQNIYQETTDICFTGLSSIKTLIKDAILFILDVPLESIAGILIALSLAYIVTQFYILIVTYFKQQLRKAKNWLRRQQIEVREVFSFYFNSFLMATEDERRVPRVVRRLSVRDTSPQRQQRIQARTPLRGPQHPPEKLNKPDMVDEKFCVICQERNKCILLLPCRHLCLCAECIRELRYYNEVCPICRTNIESTMKIFI